MARIGIYGGSFNPPHLGHLHAALQCKDQLRLDRVILVPGAVPPHKVLPEGTPDAQTRLRLVQSAAQEVGGLEVSDAELQREGPSYTVDTLRAFQTQYPHDELFLLMGTDMFLSFDSWHAPAEICKMATLVCMYRTAPDAALRQSLSDTAQALQKQFAARCVFAENSALDISSTEVRRMLFFGCGEACLPPSVNDSIRARGYYGVHDDYRQLPLDRLTAVSLSLHKPSRVPHAKGCSETAVKLAQKYGADEQLAARAGILHDVTKALTPAQQTVLCRRFGLEATPQERENPALLHAKTAAAAAETIFGESPEVCSAIRWHTTGKADMTTLEKIIYIADLVEPSRSYPGVDRLRDAVWRDLDEGVLLGLEQTLLRLSQRGQPISSQSTEARDFLLRERDEMPFDEILRKPETSALSDR